MSSVSSASDREVYEVYSVREVARAGSVPVRDVARLIESGYVATIAHGYLSEEEAVRALRLMDEASGEAYRQRALFEPPRRTASPPALPFAASTALHAVMVATIALLTTLGVKGAVTEPRVTPNLTRLVFLSIPGPGGGGGGGGVNAPAPPARAELKGRSPLRSPVRTERKAAVEPPKERPRPPDLRPVEKPVDVPVVEPAPPPVPPVTAPVAPAPSSDRDQAGVPEAPSTAPSQGSGTGGGSGTGQGTGMGEGKGAGIGSGEGGGTGGGPYRPGSGITPPGLLREVKPQYTEEARRAGIEGDVLLEIVVRSDGTVGNITLLQRLGSGLDQRAIEAVRQWRFSPARRFGTPVDVLVEIAVEFKLR